MSDKIKPSEVSEVLQQQLQEVNGSQQFDEVGTVLTVSDGVARIYGLRNAEANELLEFENGTMAIVMNLEEDNVGCVLLGPTAGIKEGQSVKRTHRIASIRVNDNFLGRVVNPLGQAIDGLGDIDLTDCFRDAFGSQGSWCDLSSASKGTSADRFEGGRLHDSYRSWTA